MAQTKDFEVTISNPKLDSLIQELSSLSPDWQLNNPDHQRSQEILIELERDFSGYDRDQAFQFMHLAWVDATAYAERLGLISSFDHKKSLALQLGGLCLVKANMKTAQQLIPNL